MKRLLLLNQVVRLGEIESSDRSQRDYHKIMLAIVWVSLALQLIVLRELEHNSIFFYNLPAGVDQHAYIKNAQELVLGQWPSQAAFNLSPFYSFYLGLIYKFLGYSMVLPRIFQVFEGVLVCAILYKLGQTIFNVKIGLLAAFLLATYAPFIFYNLELTTVPHSILLVTLVVWLTVLSAKRTKLIYLCIIGLALGLAALAQPQNFMALGGIGIWFSLRKSPLTSRVMSIFVICAIAGVITAIPSWHNFQLTGQLKFITTSGDRNLYIGNNPQATGVYNRVSPEVTAQIKAQEHSYLIEVFWFIRNHPSTWLLLTGRKLILYLVGSDMELGSNVNFYFWGVLYSSVLRSLPLRYELISLLSLIGLRFIWQNKSALLYFSYGCYTLGTILFFVQARFRMSFVPILILLSTAVCFELYQRYQRGDKAILLIVFGIILSMVAILIRYHYLLNGNLTIAS